MNNDNFTETARAEAEQYGYENAPTIGTTALVARAHLHGWEAARAYLAAQEPTDDFITAARVRANGQWPMQEERHAFVTGAVWARDHLAARKTDHGYGPKTTEAVREWTGSWPPARAARRDEKDRP